MAMSHSIGGNPVDVKPALDREQARSKEENDKRKRIFVGGLPKNLPDKELEKRLSEFGPIDKCYVVKDPIVGKTRGFGFVVFKTEESYMKAIQQKVFMIGDKEVHIKSADGKNTDTNSSSHLSKSHRQNQGPKAHPGSSKKNNNYPNSTKNKSSKNSRYQNPQSRNNQYPSNSNHFQTDNLNSYQNEAQFSDNKVYPYFQGSHQHTLKSQNASTTANQSQDPNSHPKFKGSQKPQPQRRSQQNPRTGLQSRPEGFQGPSSYHRNNNLPQNQRNNGRDVGLGSQEEDYDPSQAQPPYQYNYKDYWPDQPQNSISRYQGDGLGQNPNPPNQRQHIPQDYQNYTYHEDPYGNSNSDYRFFQQGQGQQGIWPDDPQRNPEARPAGPSGPSRPLPNLQGQSHPAHNPSHLAHLNNPSNNLNNPAPPLDPFQPGLPLSYHSFSSDRNLRDPRNLRNLRDLPSQHNQNPIPAHMPSQLAPGSAPNHSLSSQKACLPMSYSLKKISSNKLVPVNLKPSPGMAYLSQHHINQPKSSLFQRNCEGDPLADSGLLNHIGGFGSSSLRPRARGYESHEKSPFEREMSEEEMEEDEPLQRATDF